MAEYEELVELGFEGVDKFADKYHDRVYDHLPAVPRKKKQRDHDQQQRLDNRQDQEKENLQHKQRHERGEADPDDLSDLRSQHDQQRQDLRGQQQDQRRDLKNTQNQQNKQWQKNEKNPKERSSQHPDKGYDSPRPRPRSGPPESTNGYPAVDPKMYGQDRQQRDNRGASERYYEDERTHYKGPDAGTVVPQTRNAYDNMRGQQMAVGNASEFTYVTDTTQPYQQQSQRGFDDYDNRDRGRPQPERRSSSWSPPRSERRDRRDRDRHGARSGSRSKDKQHRILATVGGALVGGLAANQIRKGKSHDTAATIIGAIVGGVGAREASEFIDQKRRKRDVVDDKWEEEHSGDDDRRDNSRRDDRRDNKYDRDDRYDRR